MTNRLGNLTERGLIDREPNPRDGRSVIIRLTDAGAARADAAMLELVGRERIALSVLSPADVAALAQLLRPLMG